VVATGVHPAAERHGLIQLGGGDMATIVGAHDRESSVENRKWRIAIREPARDSRVN
jgi:hypothetical protein